MVSFKSTEVRVYRWLAPMIAILAVTASCAVEPRPVVSYGDIGSGNAERPALGRLMVRTDTFAVYDGGIYYYPHLPYEIHEVGGRRLMGVANHLSDNDESPSIVELPPAKYLVRADTSAGHVAEFLVTIAAGQLSEVDVPRLQK